MSVNAPGVLANDTDADGGRSARRWSPHASHGSLTFNTDGSFSYTPNGSFFGTDSFTYTATDGHATSAPATVTFTVYSVPVATADTYALMPGNMLSVTAPGVLGNDTNADGNALTATARAPARQRPADAQYRRLLLIQADSRILAARTASTTLPLNGPAVSAPATVHHHRLFSPGGQRRSTTRPLPDQR